MESYKYDLSLISSTIMSSYINQVLSKIVYKNVDLFHIVCTTQMSLNLFLSNYMFVLCFQLATFVQCFEKEDIFMSIVMCLFLFLICETIGETCHIYSNAWSQV
jgi:hypothetical protein